MNVGEDLWLFRAVEAPARRSMAMRILNVGMGGGGWRPPAEGDIWELRDAALGCDEEPAALAATWPLGDGRRVQLVALVVDRSQCGRGIGQRMVEEVCDALRARGVLMLVAAVPSDSASAIVIVQRAGLRASHVEPASAGGDGHDRVWFHLQL